MTPGKYLQLRRVMAGYSVAGLARELLDLTGFGTARTTSDLHRLHATLIAAEDGSLHHSAERIDLIRNFVPLDPTVYFRLIELDRDMPGLSIHGVCRVCACTFHDACSVPADPLAGLGATTCCWVEANLCSACADAARNRTSRVPPARPTIAEQLRDVGERIRRFHAQAHTIPTEPHLRLVPKEGEN